MSITFQKTSKVSTHPDSPIVTTDLQLNVDANKILSYPGSGSTWFDISGNNYDYTLVGDAIYDSNDGGSINFTNDSIGSSTNFNSLFITSGEFTYEVWVNPTSNSGVILNEIDGTGWSVSLIELVGGDVRVGFWYNTQVYTSLGSIPTGEWSHIVMKYSGSTLNGYINGVLSNTLNSQKQYPSSGNYFITLAASQSTNFGSGDYYNGKISSVKYYNRCLTDVEILQNYNALKYRYIPVNLVSSVTMTLKPPFNDGTTQKRAGDSAYQIKTFFPSSTDGLYWIKNQNINGGEPFQIYADMTTNGGGWTLIMQNNYNGNTWNENNGILKNELTPPSTLQTGLGIDDSNNYSIIAWADYLKSSPSGFQYMIEANSRGHYGGIWQANEPYSFIGAVDLGQYSASGSAYFGSDVISGSDGFRQNITEILKFPTDSGTWNYNNMGLEHRMPWYSNSSNLTVGNAVITTTHDDNGSWWGTLITYNGWNPAPWQSDVGMSDPGVIWYWVR